MKRLVMTGPMTSIVTDALEPNINKPNQLKIRLKYCGVCMSEHYFWETAKKGMSFGHEPVGVVVEVGEDVHDFKPGDRVSGRFAGDSEYAIADHDKVFLIPDNVKDEEAILEPLSCLVSAVSKVKLPVMGEKVAVVGCGYMGCGAISLLKMRGAYVVAVDIRRESLENAKRYGADEIYTPNELPAEYFSRPGLRPMQTGFEMVMEWGETAESLDLAIQMTRMCGQLAIGAYHTGGKRLVDVQTLNVKAIDCLSTHPREADLNRRTSITAMRMLADDSWNFKHVPTKVYPLCRFDQAQSELTRKYGKFMKAIVSFENNDFEPYIIE